MKTVIAMIPARMASTRFPGKPLVDICGRPMIEHVWRRVRLNPKINSAYIVTCDEQIRRRAEDFGAMVIMTSDKHQRGTDRVAEGCSKLLQKGNGFDVVLNVQGDEPLLNSDSLDLLLTPFLEGEDIACVNLMEILETEAEINNYNNVKTVFDRNNLALYFSRLPIPNGVHNRHYKQLGLYGFTREAIMKYSIMEQTPFEIAESDDMLRFVENGMPVKMVLSPGKTFGVDTPDDYKKVSTLMEKDALFLKYKDA